MPFATNRSATSATPSVCLRHFRKATIASASGSAAMRKTGFCTIAGSDCRPAFLAMMSCGTVSNAMRRRS